MRRLIALWMLCALADAAPVLAQPAEADACALIDDRDERLICYDSLFRVETTLQTPASAETGSWTIYESKSRITDADEVTLMVLSRDPVIDRFGLSQSYGQLVIGCVDGNTVAIVNFADHFMSDVNGGGKVTYRIDKSPAGKARWNVSNDNSALGLWSGKASIPFIKKLFGANNLLVVATPFNENSLEFDFPIDGLEKAIEPLRKACGW